MSLVGSRHLLPDEVEKYDGRVARQTLVKPGAPASGRYRDDPIFDGKSLYDWILHTSNTGRSCKTL
jgi:hypothetical protein